MSLLSIDNFFANAFENLTSQPFLRHSSNRQQGAYEEEPDDPPSNTPLAFDGKIRRLDDHDIDMINEDWDDTEETSMLWEIVSQGMIREFVGIIQDNPEIIHHRSADGRGPMWWAYEFKRPKMIDIMKKLGVSEERKDQNGIRPIDL